MLQHSYVKMNEKEFVDYEDVPDCGNPPAEYEVLSPDREVNEDDYRIPAINLYYSLGFRPIYNHESHEKRWAAILPRIKTE